MIVSVALAFLAAAASPSEVPAQATTAPAAKPVKEKKICQVDAATTGSLLPHKVCKTKAEWEALAARERAGQGDRERSANGSDD